MTGIGGCIRQCSKAKHLPSCKQSLMSNGLFQANVALLARPRRNCTQHLYNNHVEQT